MRKHVKTSIAAATLVTGLLASLTLHAHETAPAAQGSMMQPGQMMGGHMSSGMMQGGQGGMTGQMNQMMDSCNKMMQVMMEHHQEGIQKPGQAPKKGDG